MTSASPLPDMTCIILNSSTCTYNKTFYPLFYIKVLCRYANLGPSVLLATPMTAASRSETNFMAMPQKQFTSDPNSEQSVSQSGPGLPDFY
jgi:hypothetical protein